MRVVRLKGWVAGYIAALGSGGIWRSGSGAPDDADHNNGDYYRDTDTDDLYVKEAGSWVAADFFGGAGGGADGASFLSGVGVPASGLGADGDSYVDTSTGTTYAKSGGSWAADGGSLMGPQGPAGADGPQGAQGIQGEQGPAGADGADGSASRYVLDLDADALPQTITAAQHGLGSTVTVTTSDGLGASITGSGDVTITGSVDGSAIITAKPAAPTITPVSGAETQPTITGTYDDSDLVELHVSIDGTTYTTSDAALTASGGSWSLDLSTAAQTLTAGSYDVVARADWSGGSLFVASVDGVAVTSSYTPPAYRYGNVRGPSGKRLLGPAVTTTADLSVVAYIRSQGTGGVNFRAPWALDNGTQYITLRINNSSGAAEWLVKDASGAAIASVSAATMSGAGIDLDDGLPHLLVGVIESGALTLYVDGTSVTGTATAGGASLAGAVVAGSISQGGHPNGNQNFDGSVAACLIGRALSDVEVDALTDLSGFEGDPDLIAMARVDADVYKPLHVGATYVDAATATSWTYSAAEPTASKVTEDGSVRSRLVLMIGQSNARTTGVTYSGANTVAGVFLSDPDSDAGASELLTDWATNVGGTWDGPEVSAIHEQGSIERMLLKVTKGSTKAQEWIDTYYPIAQSRMYGAGLSLAGGGGGAVLWMQGEGDATTSAEGAAYAGKLATLIASWRADGAAHIVLFSPPDGAGIGAYIGDVRAAMAAAAAANSDVTYIDETGLAVQADGIHLTEASVIQRGASAVTALVAAGIWDAA